RQYAPEGCDLYYNDYNEYWDHKRDCIYNMCKSLYQKGLLDGVGMQSHVPANATGFAGTDSYTEAMKKYLSIGCDVQITELDISLLKDHVPTYSYSDQAKKYCEIFKAAVDWNNNPQSDGRVTLVQIWGPNDGNSWLESGSNALLYDSQNNAKQCYNDLMTLLPESEWKGPGQTAPLPEPELDENGYWINIDFENGAGGFTGRGAATAEVSSKEHFSGSNSLYVSGRTAEWNGAGTNLNTRIFKAGETYSFSTNVQYTGGEDVDTFYLSLQYKGADGETYYDHIAEATAGKGEWVQLMNTTYTLPEGASQFNLYVEMPKSTSDFYIDDVIASVAGRALPGAGESTAKPARTSALTGDVNGDGIIDIFDLGMAKRGILKGFANKYDERSADVDGSGTVEVADLVMLTQWLHGKLKEFPVPETPPAAEYDHSKWDNYQETASPQYIDFYKSSIKNMGNTYRLTKKLAAAEAGEPLTVAYLGGSITEGKNYTTPFSNYLKENFAKGGFTEVNAGMSGTSSVVGLVRSEKDIVAKNPDIIFIEFSVNDHEDILYKKGLESVIKKFLELPNEPAVGIIINRSKGGFSTQAQMAPIGQNYDIPVISMDDALTKAFNSGFLQAGDYFTDEYHPHQKGGQLVADCMAYWVRQALKSENSDSEFSLPSKYVYGAEYSSCVNSDPKTFSNFNAGSWTAGTGYGSLPFGYTCNGGSPMTFKTNGKGFIVVFKANSSGMGSIDVTVNGKTTKISGNKQYTWGGPDAELGYYQETAGDLDVSISGSGSFTIWGIGLIQ
ncbi:MAG: endo-1,4-beta-xylanase, partial [Oscillospiraceae bacterium]|nr:endo-1,4-beta-xylanase [Oscillospiraceae bacterium]